MWVIYFVIFYMILLSTNPRTTIQAIYLDPPLTARRCRQVQPVFGLSSSPHPLLYLIRILPLCLRRSGNTINNPLPVCRKSLRCTLWFAGKEKKGMKKILVLWGSGGEKASFVVGSKMVDFLPLQNPSSTRLVLWTIRCDSPSDLDPQFHHAKSETELPQPKIK